MRTWLKYAQGEGKDYTILWSVWVCFIILFFSGRDQVFEQERGKRKSGKWKKGFVTIKKQDLKKMYPATAVKQPELFSTVFISFFTVSLYFCNVAFALLMLF